MNVSVITTTYNRSEYFRLLLAALSRQSCLPDEVVVADDGSSPDHAAAMRRAIADSPLACTMVTQDDKGFRAAAARNLAIRASKGDYLIFLDCDILPLPDVLKLHLEMARPGYVLSGNRAFLSEADTQHLFALRPEPSLQDIADAWQKADHSHLPGVAADFARHARRRRWGMARPHKPKVIGCHFSMCRADVERVNGFDENFEGWGYEDDDFTRRIYKAGIRPVDISQVAPALHLWHPSLAPSNLEHHRDRPNRSYFRRCFVPAYCSKGLNPS